MDSRDELRQQHTILCAKLKKAREVAQEAPRDLGALLIDLSNALRWHHLREEELLPELLASYDDAAMASAASAVEDHAAEHRELYETLVRVTTSGDPQRAATAAIELFDRILAHIEEEGARWP